ncbi:MAG: hypothetical protein RMJ43_07135 [Chloroherpetonaceae bacterium]|nr:hypothetical protein [Chthonomonadaceae bacterium]MDW8207595.1 hypothetical protein [Chloroherpetonaceae bacterium]
MNEKPWFDPETGVILFDHYVTEMPSFQKVVADNVVTDEEFLAQTQKVIGLLHQLETMLTPEARTVCTTALCEMAVLNAFLHLRAKAAP